MTEAQLTSIIQNAGGKCWALEYTRALLEKINRLEAAGGYETALKQLKAAKNSGDFRGRVLEVNFADLFVNKGIRLKYEVKQDQSGNVDFSWCINNDNHVFIEMKLLGQDQQTKDAMTAQLAATERFLTHIPDDTRDVGRIQRDIFGKSSTTKFNPTPKPNWVNLVAIDVSELQLGNVDMADCLLAAGGNKLIENCHSAVQRSSVVGVFEPANKVCTDEQNQWVNAYHSVSNTGEPHPRDYIHGVLFLFREPQENAALSYELSGKVVWNAALIDASRAKLISEAFHSIIP